MPNNKRPTANDALSAREHEVAKLMTQGLSNKLIGAQLDISEHTAKFHVMNVVLKLGANSRVDAAVKYALAEAGLAAQRAAILEAKRPAHPYCKQATAVA